MSYWNSDIPFEELKGKTVVSIDKTDDTMTFTIDDGSKYEMYHSQDCCEHVYIESIVGDLDDLIGSPILVAEESSSQENPEGATIPEYQESFTWTFYKLATRKGYVDIRWYGGSNGYYGEGVSFARIVEPTGAGEQA